MEEGLALEREGIWAHNVSRFTPLLDPMHHDNMNGQVTTSIPRIAPVGDLKEALGPPPHMVGFCSTLLGDSKIQNLP